MCCDGIKRQLKTKLRIMRNGIQQLKSDEMIQHKAWFPFRRICRVCRTKKDS